MRKIIVVLLSIYLVIISMIVACATPPPAPTPPPPPSTPTPPAAYGPEWDKIVAAAKAEGELTGYGSIFTAERGLQKDFGDKYGIKINGVSALSPALAERIKTEVAIGKQVCDVSSVTFSVTTGMVNDGLLQEFASKMPELKATKTSDWAIPPVLFDGKAVCSVGTVWGPFINTGMVKGNDVPKSWYDLLNPKWNGKIVMGSPTLEGSAYRLWLAMTKMGIKDQEDYFVKLSKNNPGIKTSIFEVLDAVAKGDYAIALAGYVQYADQNRPKGVPVQLAAVDEGVLYLPGNIINMVKGCPHPNAALLFLNWSLTKEGVKAMLLSNSQNVPSRADVDQLWNVDSISTGKSPKAFISLTNEESLGMAAMQKSGNLEKLMGLPSLK